MAKRARSNGVMQYYDRRYVCEFAGTLAFVMVGCGSVAIGGAGAGTVLTVGAAFGLALIGVAYSFGAASGAHLNPAVTVAMWVAGRTKDRDAIGYIVAQCLGAIAAAAILGCILAAKSGAWNFTNLGQNGWGTGVLGGYSTGAVVLAEFVATLVFTLVILSATRNGGAMAGVVIGFTLIALHLAFFNVDGLSVNPARSLGPALLVGGNAITQLWLFLIVPTVAGAVAGFIAKERYLD